MFEEYRLCTDTVLSDRSADVQIEAEYRLSTECAQAAVQTPVALWPDEYEIISTATFL